MDENANIIGDTGPNCPVCGEPMEHFTGVKDEGGFIPEYFWCSNFECPNINTFDDDGNINGHLS